jgi:hypothetical protein
LNHYSSVHVILLYDLHSSSHFRQLNVVTDNHMITSASAQHFALEENSPLGRSAFLSPWGFFHGISIANVTT